VVKRCNKRLFYRYLINFFLQGVLKTDEMNTEDRKQQVVTHTFSETTGPFFIAFSSSFFILSLCFCFFTLFFFGLSFPFFHLATTQGEKIVGAGCRSAWSRAEARPVRRGNLREARGESAVRGGLKTWESRCPIFL
jgi:hypothetical protein